MKKLAIDFEYVGNPDGTIRHLICCVICDENGKEARYWLRDGRDTTKLVRHLKAFKDRFILISHAMELAEAQCFKKLGLDPTQFKWRDTWMEAYILQNSFFQNERENCSLAECLAKYCDIQIDVEYKKECRAYCIADSTAGHEEDILDYCASDVKYLHTLAEKHLQMFTQLISKGLAIHRDCQFSEDTLVNLAYVTNCSSEIAGRGFPVDTATCDLLKEKVPQILMQIRTEFNTKYPGTFAFGKFKGSIKATKKLGAVAKYLDEWLAANQMQKEWPRTASGQPSTDSKLLKDYKHTDTFPGDLYNLNKSVTSVQGLVKDKDPWLQNLVNGRLYYRSLRPMSSATGRCQPKISAGFVPGFSHFLYCMLNPRKGRMLFEIDFHAEETAIQADICNDAKYAEVYNSRDSYLWMAWQLGQITAEQYHAHPEDDSLWKSELKSIRVPMKTFTLAWSYGAGFRHLAKLANIKESTSQRWVNDLNHKVFKNAYKWKTNLVEYTGPGSSKYHCLVFPDGFLCRTVRYKGEQPKSDTVKMNWPFQGYGAYILRELIKKCHEERLPAIATVHDAIIFECDEGDMATVNKCFDVMTKTSQGLLGSTLLQCGAPVYWHHHTLSDILDADLGSEQGRKDFVSKVGDLVEIDDVKKFQKFLTSEEK